jgi:hypothetical protein
LYVAARCVLPVCAKVAGLPWLGVCFQFSATAVSFVLCDGTQGLTACKDSKAGWFSGSSPPTLKRAPHRSGSPAVDLCVSIRSSVCVYSGGGRPPDQVPGEDGCAFPSHGESTLLRSPCASLACRRSMLVMNACRLAGLIVLSRRYAVFRVSPFSASVQLV